MYFCTHSTCFDGDEIPLDIFSVAIKDVGTLKKFSPYCTKPWIILATHAKKEELSQKNIKIMHIFLGLHHYFIFHFSLENFLLNKDDNIHKSEALISDNRTNEY